jgi:hypothetical protein
MDEEVCINKRSINILNVCDYNITYFQCYLSVIRFCLVRREIRKEHRTTVQTYTHIHKYIYIHTYMTDLNISSNLKSLFSFPQKLGCTAQDP